jgi:hypothetical protein
MLKLHQSLVEIGDLEREVASLRAENDLARYELWRNHGHPPAALYGEPNDMFCSLCPKGFRDWRRTPLAELLPALREKRELEMYNEYLRGLNEAGIKTPVPVLTNL